MDRNSMSLDDLGAHRATINALCEAGWILKRANLNPFFELSAGLDLTGCQRIRMRLELVEPILDAPARDDFADCATVQDVMARLQTSLAEQMPGVTEPIQQDSPAAGCSSPVASAAEEGQGGATPAALAPSTPVLGSPWSAEDDETAVRLKKAGATARMIADKLGRTVGATQFRLKTKLAGLLGDTPYPSTVARTMITAPAAVPIAPPAAPVPRPVEAVARSLPTPVLRPVDPVAVVDLETPAWLREIRERLTAIGNPAPFTAAVDLEIVERLGRGERGTFVATDMGIDLPSLKRRHIALLPSVDPQAQKRLLAELRARVEGASL